MGRPSHDKRLHGNIASLLTPDRQDPCHPCRGDPFTLVYAVSTTDNPRALPNRGQGSRGKGTMDNLLWCARHELARLLALLSFVGGFGAKDAVKGQLAAAAEPNAVL